MVARLKEQIRDSASSERRAVYRGVSPYTGAGTLGFGLLVSSLSDFQSVGG